MKKLSASLLLAGLVAMGGATAASASDSSVSANQQGPATYTILIGNWPGAIGNWPGAIGNWPGAIVN